MLITNERFHDREWAGASSGRMLPSPPPPPPAPLEPVGLPAPPWADALASGNFDLAAALAPPARPAELSALDKMKLESGDVEEIRPWEPAVTTAPLRRPGFPAPNWEEEAQERRARDQAEAERLARQTRQQLLEELLLAEQQETE